MNTSDAIEQFVDQLKKSPFDRTISDELIDAIINSRASLAEFIDLSAAFTEQDSTFATDVGTLLTYRAQTEALGAYVEAEGAGEDVAKRFPAIAVRIQNDPKFRRQYEMLVERVEEEAQGLFENKPQFMDFGQWHQQQTQTEASPSHSAEPAELWQRLAHGAHQFVVELPILLKETTASFGDQLAAVLQPQRVPVGTFRQREASSQIEGEQFDEVVELPHLQTNIMLRIRTGPVTEGRGTLLVDVHHLTPDQPMAQARVTLRDADGGLLERTATDERGLAFFRELETNSYQIHVEYEGEIWELHVTLR